LRDLKFGTATKCRPFFKDASTCRLSGLASFSGMRAAISCDGHFHPIANRSSSNICQLRRSYDSEFRPEPYRTLLRQIPAAIESTEG